MSEPRILDFMEHTEHALKLLLASVLLPLGAPGLALAFAIGYVVFGFVAVYMLHRKTGGLPWTGSVGSFGLSAVAGVVCAVGVALVGHFVGADNGGGAILRLGAGVL